jgi:hypothetical protein
MAGITKTYSLGPTGNMAPIQHLATKFARANAPSTGGIKTPMVELHLTAWGPKADDIFRLKIRNAAFATKDERRKKRMLKFATKGLTVDDLKAIEEEPLEIERKSVNDEDDVSSNDEDDEEGMSVSLRDAKYKLNQAKMYLYYTEEECNGLYFTPIRSELHLNVIQAENKQSNHPWADFLIWFLNKYDDAQHPGVFDVEQRLVVVKDKTTVRLVYLEVDTPYVVVEEDGRESDRFFVYGKAKDITNANGDMKRLKAFIKKLHSN